MKKLVCYCEETIKIDFPEYVDLDKNPEILKTIMSGDFMTVKCPKCNTILKPEYPFALVKKSEKIDLFFIPEIDRNKMLKSTLPYPINNALRVVIGYPELVEKLLLVKMKLDDRAIEVLKYYLLIKAMESSDSNQEISILFKEKNKDSLIFHISGIKTDEVGISNLSNSVYEKTIMKIGSTLKTKPFSDFLSPPYVSINKLFSG